MSYSYSSSNLLGSPLPHHSSSPTCPLGPALTFRLRESRLPPSPLRSHPFIHPELESKLNGTLRSPLKPNSYVSPSNPFGRARFSPRCDRDRSEDLSTPTSTFRLQKEVARSTRIAGRVSERMSAWWDELDGETAWDVTVAVVFWCCVVVFVSALAGLGDDRAIYSPSVEAGPSVTRTWLSHKPSQGITAALGGTLGGEAQSEPGDAKRRWHTSDVQHWRMAAYHASLEGIWDTGRESKR